MGSGAIVLVVMSCVACGRLGFDDHAAAGDDDQLFADAAPAAMAMAPTDGLIAYWPFDAIAGEATADVVGGNTATCSDGNCPVLQAGLVGGALTFDGTSSHCLDVASLNNWSSGAFTISAWVASSDLDGPVVAHEGYNACPSPLLNTKHDLVGLTQVSDAGPHNEAWTVQPIAGADWHHVAVAWDGTTQMVFVDGVCSCNVVPAVTTHQYTDEFSLGCYPKQATYFTGLVDEVRIYDRVLSFDEMTMLIAAAGRAPPDPVSCAQACNTVAP